MQIHEIWTCAGESFWKNLAYKRYSNFDTGEHKIPTCAENYATVNHVNVINRYLKDTHIIKLTQTMGEEGFEDSTDADIAQLRMDKERD